MKAVWLAATLALAMPTAGCAQSDDLIISKAGDPAVEAATAEARKTLPLFWAKRQASLAGYDHFALKVAFATEHGGVEHIWVEPTSGDGETLTGTLANEPKDLKGLHARSSVEFKPGQVTDWQYSKDGKLYGHFTTRVLMDRANEAQRKEALALFAPTALEAGAN